MSDISDKISVGVIISSHGVKGEVKVKALTDFPDERFCQGAKLLLGKSPGDLKEVKVKTARWHKDFLLVTLEGISSKTESDELRKAMFFVDKPLELPQDSYYYFELEGLSVVDTKGEAVGTLTEVLDTAGGDVYVVKGDEREILVPARKIFVKNVDLDKQVMCIDMESLSFED